MTNQPTIVTQNERVYCDQQFIFEFLHRIPHAGPLSHTGSQEFEMMLWGGCVVYLNRDNLGANFIPGQQGRCYEVHFSVSGPWVDFPENPCLVAESYKTQFLKLVERHGFSVVQRGDGDTTLTTWARFNTAMSARAKLLLALDSSKSEGFDVNIKTGDSGYFLEVLVKTPFFGEVEIPATVYGVEVKISVTREARGRLIQMLRISQGIEAHAAKQSGCGLPKNWLARRSLEKFAGIIKAFSCDVCGQLLSPTRSMRQTSEGLGLVTKDLVRNRVSPVNVWTTLDSQSACFVWLTVESWCFSLTTYQALNLVERINLALLDSPVPNGSPCWLNIPNYTADCSHAAAIESTVITHWWPDKSRYDLHLLCRPNLMQQQRIEGVSGLQRYNLRVNASMLASLREIITDCVNLIRVETVVDRFTRLLSPEV